MHLTDGNLFWPKNTSILQKYEYLSEDHNTDILVIGAGISGAITAYYLANQGFHVIIVDKNIIGYGSTLATTALLEYQVDIDMYQLSNMIGEKYSKRIYALCKESIDDIEKITNQLDENAQFERKDTLYYSRTILNQNTLMQEYETRKKAGYDVSFVTSDPLLNIKCGIKTKNSSATINPYLLAQSIFHKLRSFSNVKIYEHTNIVDIFYQNGQNHCTTNNQFHIHSKYVVITTGFEATHYLPNSDYDLFKTFTIVTKPMHSLSPFDTYFTGRDTKTPYHYIRFTTDHRILYGGEDVTLLPKYEKEKNLATTSDSKYKKLEDNLKKLIKTSESIGIQYKFNGTFATTPDNLPIIDQIKNKKNCFCNLGYGANGILYATIGAKLLTNFILGEDSKDLDMFHINRN